MVECASHVAKVIAESFLMTMCSILASRMLSDRLWLPHGKRAATHPNVGAVLIIAGCENFDRDKLYDDVIASDSIHVISWSYRKIAEQQKLIRRGKNCVTEMLAQIAQTPVRPLAFKDLVIGTICGGSDGTSGITGNPAVGRAFDRLLAQGATCIFEER
ncbi:UxaA family hydrolase [Escherichia coli]|nr:UxaA family hydrolase [Escherichia coli]